MLKIRDNYPLKSLCLYGFEKCDYRGGYTYGYTNREIYIFVDSNTKEIHIKEPFRDNDGTEYNLDIIYDLMKDNLIIKE